MKQLNNCIEKYDRGANFISNLFEQDHAMKRDERKIRRSMLLVTDNMLGMQRIFA